MISASGSPRWVFCGGMQRAGSTLQFQIAAHIAEAAGIGTRHAHIAPQHIPHLLAHRHAQPLKVIKTHVFTDQIHEEFRTGHALGLYIYRDLRDVIVSFMHKDALPFDEAWVLRRLEHNLAWFYQWTAQPRLLLSRYETVFNHLPAEVARIAAHLNVPLTPTDCDLIAAQYGLEQQLETIAQAVKEQRLQHGSGGILHDSVSLLHTNHIHSGEIGGWKTWLTPPQIAFIEGHAGHWLLENGYALHTTA